MISWKIHSLARMKSYESKYHMNLINISWKKINSITFFNTFCKNIKNEYLLYSFPKSIDLYFIFIP